MKRTGRILAILICALLLLNLCACDGLSSSRKNSGSDTSANTSYSYYYDYDDMAVAEQSYGGFSMSGMYAPAPAASSTAAGSSNGSSGSGGNSSKTSDDSSDLNPEKIIYSADATVETTQFENTISALEAMIDSVGGWVESSSVTGANYSSISRGSKTNRSANYTVRVPNDKFNEMMSSLPKLGNVPRSHVYTENVTSQYYDTQARLTTYQAQEQRLLELLDKAETVSDVIEIENELTEVRYRIESMQTSLRNWDRRVSWSTIQLTVNEVSEYTPEVQKGYGERLKEALMEGLDNLSWYFVDFVEALPVLAFFLLLLIILILILKRVIWSPKRAERRRARKEAKAAAKAAKTESVPEIKEES
jgi:hypothetical protein